MNDKEFTKSVLPYSSIEIQVLEGTGLHYLTAMAIANGNTGLLVKELIFQLVKIDGKLITPLQLNELHMRDTIRIVDIIGTMMSEL
jgi:hypothetical protein